MVSLPDNSTGADGYGEDAKTYWSEVGIGRAAKTIIRIGFNRHKCRVGTVGSLTCDYRT